MSKVLSAETQIRALREVLQQGAVKLIGVKGKRLALPSQLVNLLDEILKNQLSGKDVSIVPGHRQLGTQRAADILGVSRPFMVRLLDDAKIPHHLVGTHRRLYLKDLLRYKQIRDKERHAAINRMARMEMDAGTYDTVVLPGDSDER